MNKPTIAFAQELLGYLPGRKLSEFSLMMNGNCLNNLIWLQVQDMTGPKFWKED